MFRLDTDGIHSGIFVLRWIIYQVPLRQIVNGVTRVFDEGFRKLIVDLDPILPRNRTWRTYNYVAYWASDAFVVSIWQMASAFLDSGLNWQQSLGAVALGFVLIAIPITLQGTVGARLNIPFPILVRGSFGMYLSYFCIISRSILAMFWFGISTATGGTLTVQVS
jgi:nucleobase:cation symporter-1, NCS1 family